MPFLLIWAIGCVQLLLSGLLQQNHFTAVFCTLSEVKLLRKMYSKIACALLKQTSLIKGSGGVGGCLSEPPGCFEVPPLCALPSCSDVACMVSLRLLIAQKSCCCPLHVRRRKYERCLHYVLACVPNQDMCANSYPSIQAFLFEIGYL